MADTICAAEEEAAITDWKNTKYRPAHRGLTDSGLIRPTQILTFFTYSKNKRKTFLVRSPVLTVSFIKSEVLLPTLTISYILNKHKNIKLHTLYGVLLLKNDLINRSFRHPYCVYGVLAQCLPHRNNSESTEETVNLICVI